VACALVFVEGKNDRAFFGRAFSSKSFEPRELGRAPELVFTACENTISNARRLFSGRPRQLFASGDKLVMLVQGDGKQNATQCFERVSMGNIGDDVASIRVMLVVDSDRAPDPKKLREGMLDRLARRLESAGMDVRLEPAGPKSMVSACTASNRRKSLRAGVMTVPTNFEEIFAGFLVRHGMADRGGPPKISIEKAIDGLEAGGIDGLCEHVFGKLQADIKQDPLFGQMLDELCEFVHGR